MLHRLSILACLFVLAITGAWAQDGKLAGKVLDESGAPLPFVRVIVYSGDLIKYGASTDEKGTFSIQPVAPGTYRVEARYLQKKASIDEVPVINGQTRNLTLTITATTLEEVTIYGEEPIGSDPTVGSTITGTDVVNAGTRSINSLAALTAGVYQSDEGGALSIRGARSTSTTYYVDGVKIRGLTSLPQNSISQLQVITGGTPAEYGDFTGGVISITTANPSSEFSGNLELVTSQYLDNFGRNLGAFSLSGPLVTRRAFIENTQTEYKTSVLGFFVSGEVVYNGDQDPAALGINRLRDGLLDSLEQNPVRLSDDNISFRSNANFIRGNDIVTIPTKQNNQGLRGRGLVRFDFQPTNNILVKLGGNYEAIQNDRWGIASTLFSPDQNAVFRGNNYRIWSRFQQSFPGSEGSSIRNLYYSVQADFSRYSRFFEHETFRDNFFDYGYVGKFDFDFEPFFFIQNTDFDPNDPVSSSPYWQSVGDRQANLRFDDSETRLPVYANYNNEILRIVEEEGIVNFPFFSGNFTDPTVNSINGLDELAFRQGIINGGGSGSIYSMFSPLGAQTRSYTKFEFDQYRLLAQATAEIKTHNIKAGFEFEQRVERFYNINAANLWSQMRRFTNFHISNFSDNPDDYIYLLNSAGVWNDSIVIPRINTGEQKIFDRNLRTQLGLDPDGLDFINIDGLTPEQLSLSLFNADELLDGGIGAVDYYGYTFTGDRQERVATDRFFTDTTNRPVNPFAPTYISAFIQDKFELEDIIFNVGVRVDRFDANQFVLEDPFSLYPTYSAGELASGNIGNINSFDLPASIGSDFVPYVDAPEGNFTEILGYRNGESWFDANGNPVSSNTIASRSPGGRPIPATVEERVSVNSFKDYEPQLTAMPRISFSFPISDVAVFFAHYDVLAQRPGQLGPATSSLAAGQIQDYVFLENRPTTTVNSPNLRPEITVDYEAGFKQRVGQYIGLTLSAFYREQRNMIRFRRFANAYPFSYDTYDNLDFGTVKGFSFNFDLRRFRNIRFRGAYTLQFASATGSSFSSARAVVNFLEGVGVLRAPQPINTDQRHRISVNLDYRYTKGPGPGITIGEKTFHPFRNAGLNLIGQIGSGTPYSKNSVPTPSVKSGVNIVNRLQGSPNGARKPWQFRIDLRLDKSFQLGGKQLEGGGKSHLYDFNVYVTMLNALNTLNVINVYRFTGLPDDDGYLASDLGEQDILSQIDPVAFVDLYNIRLQNPNNYSVPRRIRLGILFNF
ncbi:MAG: TonB-dependent receptor [Bacteroidota bacterium]